MHVPQCDIWEKNVFILPPTTQKGMMMAVVNALRIIKLYRHYKVVITADLRTGQLFGLFRKLFSLKKPKHIMLELRLDDKRDTIIWKLKNWLQKYCFSSVDLIFVSTTIEIQSYSERLSINQNILKFLPFHTNVVKPAIVQNKNGYIFSAGRTGRDYKTLVEAVDGLDIQVIIVSDSKSIRGINLPENVTLYENIPYSRYRELLAACRIVVVPLEEHIYASGQVVILEGMALGKPVITTRSVGTVDYIQAGDNGMLTSAYNVNELRTAITSILDNADLELKLGNNAFNTVVQKHTFEIYLNTILSAAKKLVG